MSNVLTEKFIRLKTAVGGNREVTAYEDTFGMTKEEARSKMNAMYGDPNGPYLNRDHAQHREFVDNMLKYQEILSSN